VTLVTFTHVGGPTTILEFEGWRIVTDPTFDSPGRTYPFGWGASSRKLGTPSMTAADVGPIDAVLLTHDQHADNLDDTGRELLPKAHTVVTTTSGARRIAENAVGLRPWQTIRAECPGRPTIALTATPCRHGPPGSRRIVGDVIGFALTWEGQRHGALWISGDTVLYRGVRQVADRMDIGTAILHLGGVQFPVTGPIKYTMKGRQAIELCSLLEPATAIPVHYEGWSHFRDGRSEVERAIACAPPRLSDVIRWAPIGRPIEIDV
jgi:L-ascorbate metabolism protein UlaG (beta-lactamase superfamily)